MNEENKRIILTSLEKEVEREKNHIKELKEKIIDIEKDIKFREGNIDGMNYSIFIIKEHTPVKKELGGNDHVH